MNSATHQSVIFYGDNSEVNVVDLKDYNDYHRSKENKASFKGFDPQYSDFVDYIIKITHQIWEEKGIGIIYDTYHNNVVMHLGSYNVSGIAAVIGGTLQTLYSFPDRKLIGQNVIWSRCGEEGYLSSHRILSTATNLNDSAFGKATGKSLSFRTAVDCAAVDNRIYEEWLVRDNLWIVKQLGYDPVVVAKQMAKNIKNPGCGSVSYCGIGETVDGQLFPTKYTRKDEGVGEFIYEMFHNVYNCRLFNEVKQYYSENAVIHYICDEDLTGYQQIQSMLVNLFASFPAARCIIERVTCNTTTNSDSETHDVALRWRLIGLHQGLGFFGRPTNKPVEMLCITHFKVVDTTIVEEWVTFDALDVLKQIVETEREEDSI